MKIETVNSSVSLPDRLRAETKLLHEKAETVLGLPTSQGEYTRQLTLLFGYLLPWEHQLQAARTRFGPHLRSSERSAWLREDLRALGYTSEGIDGLPLATELPPFGSMESVLGSLYVWEGSTLGGQMIAKHVREMGVPPEAVRYHSSYGPEVRARWSAFKEELMRYSGGANEQAVVDGAKNTFATLCVWAERCR